MELLARCVRVWTFESALDPDAIKLSESIIKARRPQPLGSCRSPRRRRCTRRRPLVSAGSLQSVQTACALPCCAGAPTTAAAADTLPPLLR